MSSCCHSSVCVCWVCVSTLECCNDRLTVLVICHSHPLASPSSGVKSLSSRSTPPSEEQSGIEAVDGGKTKEKPGKV